MGQQQRRVRTIASISALTSDLHLGAIPPRQQTLSLLLRPVPFTAQLSGVSLSAKDFPPYVEDRNAVCYSIGASITGLLTITDHSVVSRAPPTDPVDPTGLQPEGAESRVTSSIRCRRA
ncbi:hypothetical protein DPEC_G00174570 [Dallia pectoralis]|uniref:Uncharacterized protein n=1 Tax=Dallia pectoralis TaxID=75939 RepID=A0ACC2GEI7_DALPE|nr:hypothetical protein DPEC_G00174570 [Dallia pectoralis]